MATTANAASPNVAAAAATDSNVITGRAALAQFESGRPVPGCRNTDELLAAHKTRTGGKPYFRFPPEPNGYLHIGHAKSMRINFGEAQANGGKCYLRYDDTNPETEEQEYIDSIVEMVRWMGWAPDWVTYSSDYFDKLYELAVTLIKKDKAYIDHSTGEEIKMQRETLTESKWRNRPIEESLRLFEHMKQGRFAEGAATLRLKMDMKNVNPNLRDIVAYRIKYCEHPHAGDKWCIYPSYDYTHCLVDSLEDIDYSICTLEFETRRESYFWLLAELDMFRPHVWEFSRLNVTGSLLSKRKIIVLVNKGIVRGFDDPRLLTLAGLRRRGYTPKAINKFCDLVGVSRAANVINVKLLEHCLREELDTTVQRRMGVIDPVRLLIENWQGEQEYDVANHPNDASMGSRKMKFSHDLLVDASDYRLDGSDSNFYGLAPGRVVGLKYSGNVTVKSIDVDARTGKATCIRCDIDFDRAVKPKTNISWVSAAHAQRCEVRLYTPLLTDDKAAIVPDFLQFVDANSETIAADAAVEKNLTELPVHASVQFERFGYFSVDPDTKDGKLVMNRVVSLREDKEKAAPAPKPAAKASNNKQPKQAKEPKAAAPAPAATA